MKLQFKNMIYLFKNIRTRSIIIVTACILIFGFLYGFMRLTNKKIAVENTSIQLKETPDIDSVPGGLKNPPSADYQRLQAQQNLEQAAIAEKTGASVIDKLAGSTPWGLCDVCTLCKWNGACISFFTTQSIEIGNFNL